MSKLKWTIKGNKEIVYQGTLKNMELFTGHARLEEKNVLYGEGECRAGIKVGVWQHYHENGRVMSRETYDEKGCKQGLSELFYANGSIWSTTVYQNNKPVGEMLRYYDTGELNSRSIYDTSGKPVSCQEYYANGNLRLEQTFIAGRMSSEQRYQKDGTSR